MGKRWRLPVVLVAVVVVAEGAVLLLRPRDGVLEPAPVSATSYFSRAQIDRAEDFRGGQLALLGGQVALQGALLVLLVRRPPAWLTATRRHPLLAGAAVGAGLAVALTAVALPLGAVARARSVDVGLTTQSWGGWALDTVKATGITAVFAGAGAFLLLAVMRRFPRRWWIPVSGGAVAVAIALVYVSPVLLDPLFNDFEELPDGRLRSEVVELAERAGVDVGEVFVVDASRRTTGANAYVNGLGRTKRVVLYDTLLRDFTPDEVRLVVAHELAHVHYEDLIHGLLWVALVTPLGMLGIQLLTKRLTKERGTAAVLPAFALAAAVVALPVQVISNTLSRDVEARADTFSLELTGEPRPFIGFERRIAVQNVADPDPPSVVTWLLGTHPPTIERIGAGVTFEREQAAGRRP